MKRLFASALAVALIAGAAVLPAGAQAAGAGGPSSGPAGVLDPIEPVNRALFGLDNTINRAFAGRGRVLIGAIWFPRPVRAAAYNVLDNLDEPATIANALMQGKGERAVGAAGRFGVNSTAGVLGTFDVASGMGLKRTREDFGQTLATWGVTPGPYVFVPLSGPTTARDQAGDIVDSLFSPLHWVSMTQVKRRSIALTKYLVQPSTVGIRQEARAAADAGVADDEYAHVRALYAQQRELMVADRPNLADNPIATGPDRRR